MSALLKTAALTVATIAALAGAISQANASCKQSICVHGSDDRNTHYVYVTDEFGSGVTHYNVRYPYGGQFELGVEDTRFSFSVRKGKTYKYSVQACQKKGFLEGSRCSPWVQFTHTVR